MVAAIVTIYVISLVLFIPVFLLYTTNWTVDPTTNVTIAVLSHRPHYPFPPEVPRHIVAVLTAVLQPTSVITVTVSSVLVIVKLGVARKKRKQMSNSQSETSAGQSEAKITKMLLSVCILFIIFTLPETIGTLVSFLLPEFGLKRCYHNTYELYYRTVVVASCLNSSVNFIAYVSLSTKFRTTLGQILPCSTVRGTAGDTSTPGESTLSVSRLTSSWIRLIRTQTRSVSFMTSSSLFDLPFSVVTHSFCSQISRWEEKRKHSKSSRTPIKRAFS